MAPLSIIQPAYITMMFAELGHQPQVVRDQDDAGAVLLVDPVQQVHDLGLDGHVQRRRWLVGQEEAGFAGQGDGDEPVAACRRKTGGDRPCTVPGEGMPTSSMTSITRSSLGVLAAAAAKRPDFPPSWAETMLWMRSDSRIARLRERQG